MSVDPPTSRRSAGLPRWPTLVLAAALVVLAGLSVWLRAPSPSSSSDAQVLLALQPGEGRTAIAPLWWLAGRAMKALTGYAFTGLLLLVVGGWVALVWGTGRLARELGLDARAAVVAAAIVAAWPPLLWRAGTVGPEVPGLAVALVSVVALRLEVRGRGAPWLGAVLGAAACGVWPGACWLVAPVLAWAVWSCARAGRSNAAWAALAGGVAVAGVLWGAWWLLAQAPAARLSPAAAGERLPWLTAAAGSPWLGLAALTLGVLGGVLAWRSGRKEAVALAAVGLGSAGVGAALTASGTGLLAAVPGLAALAGALAGRGARRRWWGLGAAAIWIAAAVLWAWPAIQARRQPAPVWAALTWAREHLPVGEAPVVFDPEHAAAVRLLLAPAGFELLEGGSPEARTAVEAGQGPVRVGRMAEPGAEVLKAWRWPSANVQRLVLPADAACVVSRLQRTDPVRVSRGWRKVDDGFVLGEQGLVALEPGTPARALKLKIVSGRVRIRMAGLPVLDLGAESPLLSFSVLPGPAGAMAFEPVGGSARFAAVDLAPLEGGGHAALIVPQAAAVTGIGGSYWQTDLVLANPHPVPVSADVLFLPSDRANPTARRARFEVPASGSRLVENVLAVGELRQGPRTGALLVRTSDCSPPACGVHVLSRTYNIQGERCDPIAEGLPGLPPERGLGAGSIAVFGAVANDNEHRGYVGFASWSPAPARVRAMLRGRDGKVLATMDEQVAPWGHRHLRLPAGCRDATLEVAVEGGSGTLVFPYLSTVASAQNCSTHRYPDRTEGGKTSTAEPRFPEVETGGAPGG